MTLNRDFAENLVTDSVIYFETEFQAADVSLVNDQFSLARVVFFILSSIMALVGCHCLQLTKLILGLGTQLVLQLILLVTVGITRKCTGPGQTGLTTDWKLPKVWRT